MDLGISGRVAIVTGGSKGIGRLTAEMLAAEGVKVAICSRSIADLEVAAAEIVSATGGTCIPVTVDVTNWDAVQKLVAETKQKLGPVGILVNCAAAPGGLVKNNIEEADETALLHDLNTKLMGYFRLCKACVPHMRQQKWGRIINVGGLTARCTEALSGMRNTAIVHMTKTLSDNLGKHGITANIVHPGVTRTDHILEWFGEMADEEGVTLADIVKREAEDPAALGRMLETKEVCDLIVYLASERASGVTGESIAVDGGLSRAVFL